MAAQRSDVLVNVVADAASAVERAWRAGEGEAALEEDWIAAVLEEPLIASYRVAMGKGPRPACRDALLTQVFDELRRRKAPPAWTFPAEGSLRVDDGPATGAPEQQPETPDEALVPRAPRLMELRVDFEGRSIAVRLEQAIAARHWGVWYALGDPGHQDLLDAAWRRSEAAWLVRALAFLNRLAPGYAAERLVIFPGRIGADFEQLVLDVLDEERRTARHATLDEDLFEKTDLRVRVPGLDRKRGARVQVTLVTEPARLGRKLGKVAHRDEVVVVSPHTLAMGAWGMAGTESLSREEAAALLEAVGTHPTSAEALALGLRTVFVRAMAAPGTPLGALLRVPAPVRRWVRAYVTAQARDTTRQMRARHGAGGSTIPRGTPTRRRGRG